MTRQCVKQRRTVEQHMWNYEHDLDKQCQAVLAFSNLTCQIVLLGAVSVETLESLSLYLTNFLGSLYRYKMSYPKPQKVQSMRKTSQVPIDIYIYFFFFLFDNSIHINHIKYQHQELS